MRDTAIVRALDVRIPELLAGVGISKPTKGKRYKKTRDGRTIHYMDIVCAFDIETSHRVFDDVDGQEHGWMYIWQWQFGDRATVIGRNWDEFLILVYEINEYLKTQDARLMVFVHNLSYEFQYLSGVWPFTNDDIFAVARRDPLYCLLDRIEMRCSYHLSNYALGTWAKVMCVDHQKLTGDLDYSVVRYPWTELTDQEIAYCVNDVVAVVECVYAMMHMYGDTLNSIPYTSTGYVRREVKGAMAKWSRSGILSMQNDLSTYDRLREVFRGGDTHANRYRVGALIGDVWSFDRSSSYPDVIVHCKFPMSKFRTIPSSWDAIRESLQRGRCVIAKIGFYRIRLRDPLTGDPYIDTEHCTKPGYTIPIHPEIDNHRIMSAEYLEVAITDIDLKIIQSQYKYESAYIFWAMAARYGYLPQPLIDVVISLFREKTMLKGVEERQVEYNHKKALLNSCYGMMCQRVITNPIIYTGDPFDLWLPDPDIDRDALYAEAIQRTTLNYAWAVWVTAWARYRLWEGVKVVNQVSPRAFVYCDTDSVKSDGDLPDFGKFNAARIRDAKRSGAYATDPSGVVHYMGVFENEGKSDLFKTLGAKRYCTVADGKLKITVAGVPKDTGSKVISNVGIENFDFDFVFRDVDKLGSLYNDADDFTVVIDGHQLRITRNVVLVNMEHRMKTDPDYQEMLGNLQLVLDGITMKDYNRS